MITSLDFVGIPSQDADRSRSFYVDTLGLRPDDKSDYEFWVGDTCFGIWEPEKMGRTFDTGVCYMALFRDPDGNDLMLHHRHTPREG